MSKINQLIETIKNYDGPPILLMEVCGTHTHNIFQYGIPAILSKNIELISGPGCPVCVTPPAYIDRAAELSLRQNSAVYTFGDMIRVPGQRTSLLKAKADGGDVRLMYSPMDVLSAAERQPDITFTITAVGFETTLPVYALLLRHVRQKNLKNIKLLTSIKALMPALEWICQNNTAVSGFIGPGHVSAILGSDVYRPLCEKYKIPLAVAGFGYEHIIAAVYDLLIQCGKGSAQVHNLYGNAVFKEGNTAALELVARCFKRGAASWRGLGAIADSGYYLSEEYEEYDIGSTFDEADTAVHNACRCGEVITGRAKPSDCKFFGGACTPLSPLGPCMVSMEGTCGIWHKNKVSL